MTTNKLIKCHIFELLHVQMSDNYASKYASYKLSAVNNVTRGTGIHTFHITGISP